MIDDNVTNVIKLTAFCLSNWVTTELTFMTFDWLEILGSKSNDRNNNPIVTRLFNVPDMQDLLSNAYFLFLKINVVIEINLFIFQVLKQ